MIDMRIFANSLLLFLLSVLFVANAEEAVCDAATAETCHLTDDAYDHATAVVEQLRSLEGGFVNEKLQVRRLDPTDHSSPFGVFASAPIEADELLLKLPPESYFRVESTGNYEDDVCQLKSMLLKEMHMGESSKFANYINFVKALNMEHLPSLWSEEGKQLLEDMLYDEDIDEDVRLPPEGATDFYDLDCFDATNDEDILAMAVIISRGLDTVLTPVYDFIRHHNDNINTENTSAESRDGFIVKASEPIAVGQELYVSFDRCLDCGDDPEYIGTPEIFRDLGVLEEYPQRFHFGGDGITTLISFDIELVEDENGETILAADWIFDHTPLSGSYYGGTRFMIEHLERLKEYKTAVLLPARGTVPDQELDAILQYHQALINALTLGVSLAEEDYWEPEVDYSLYTYNATAEYVLPEETVVIDHLDGFRRVLYQAETLVYASDHYDEIQRFQSQYQLIEHYYDPKTRDTCFNLDTIFQMCGSYWPYYHEVQVHKAAKYIQQDIKRVLFVGAGDNGLLNEIVKYPSLELVVGLELDQHVARLAFKHFGAQPHYHNEKVQWWYGDASKTLFMLPKEYFGSFDLVLVDLSDTIFALTVSDELDVVGALSLLLRPGGVFAMNELFFKKVSDVFEYALYYQFYNIPKLGDQGFVFASNDVDLLNQELTDHHIENVHVEDTLLKTDHQFRHVHDYRRNPSSTFDKLCKTNTSKDTEVDIQETSPAIFMALEAEELKSKDLASPSKVKKAIAKALQKQGMHVISSTDNKKTESSFVTVFKEGYVVVRLSAREKYCAFDVLLWSSFDKFEAVKQAVVKSLGGSMYATSSFRIVTGGMFGVSTWKEDAKSHGPQITKQCAEDSGSVRASASPSSLFDIAVEGSLELVQHAGSFVVAVLCGTEDEPCKSINVLEQSKKVSLVIPLYACSGTAPMEESKSCSSKAAKTKLDVELAKTEAKVQMVVVDPKATIVMDGVIDIMDEELLLEEDVYAVAMIDSQKDLWKRSVVDRIRTRITRLDPVFRAHVLFNTTESSMELAVASSGDEYFIEHLKEAVSTMEEKSGLALEIRNIIGGLWKGEPNYIVEDDEGLKFFRPEDYNHTSSLKQYKAQQPIGAQSISQYTNMVKRLPTKLALNEVKKGFDKVMSSKRIGKDLFTTSYDTVGDGILHMAIWDSGMIVLVWDGRVQLDVNIFCANREILEGFQQDVEKAFLNLQIKLRDFHPRGYGRVVNFAEDVADMPEPHWA